MEDRYSGPDYGGHFKSKGEIQIARLLERNRIRYFYEHPTAVVDKGQVKVWYPDFTLPEYGMIIEYFGVHGDEYYRRQSRHKKEVYEANGIEALLLSEASFKGDWPSRITEQIHNILERRLKEFQKVYRRASQ